MAADAEVYYQSQRGCTTPDHGLVLPAAGKRFIFRVASDSDCEKEMAAQSGAIANCSTTGSARRHDRGPDRLQGAVRERTTGSIAPSAHDGRPRAPARMRRRHRVLWVSNLRALKRPELALELARQLPQVKFTLAGGRCRGQQYYDDMWLPRRHCPTSPCRAGAYGTAARCSIAQDLSQHLEHRSFPTLPAGLDPRRSRGVVFDPDALVKRCSSGTSPTR